MELNLYTQSLLWAFGLSLVFGAIANKANFCTMGAVSDWINMGDLNRMRSWLLAIATAIIGVGLLEYSGSIDLSLTTSNETSNPRRGQHEVAGGAGDHGYRRLVDAVQ
jgi:hypothetical protein